MQVLCNTVGSGAQRKQSHSWSLLLWNLGNEAENQKSKTNVITNDMDTPGRWGEQEKGCGSVSGTQQE